jgi:hypothetical protein
LLQNANAQLSGRFWRAPLDAVGVMALYDKLLQWMAQHAVTVEGIFRKSPQNAQFIRLRNFIESKGLTGDVPADTDPYLVANLIKTLLGELPGSILTRYAFGLFADAAGNGDDNDDAAFAAELRALIDAHLPKRNQRLLADLFALCRVISTVHVDETKMTSSNLATCISPNFVTPLEELFNANQSSLLQAYKLFHRVTRVLIDSYDAIFEPATDSFAAEILRAHNVPKSAAVAASTMDSDDNTANDEDDEGDDESDVVEAVVVMAPIVDTPPTRSRSRRRRPRTTATASTIRCRSTLPRRSSVSRRSSAARRTRRSSTSTTPQPHRRARTRVSLRCWSASRWRPTSSGTPSCTAA